MQADRRMAEVDLPQRGHGARLQIEHGDVVGVDVLVNDHPAPLGVEGRVVVADDPQQPPSVGQVAIVDQEGDIAEGSLAPR
jgi:hypothetical protein